MRILFYCHEITGGGAERVTSILVNEFSRRGESVYLATNLSRPLAFKINPEVKLEDLNRKCTISSSLFNRIHNIIRYRYNIRHIAKKVNPDVIVAIMAPMGCMVAVSTLGLKRPVIICEHTNVSRFISRFYNLRRRLCYPLASCVTVLTRYDMGIWRKTHKNVVYMPNPVALNLYESSEKKNKVVLAAGRVGCWYIKGFDNLIKCWAHLCQEFPDWKLQIAGQYDQESKDYLDAIIKETKSENVEYLGFREDIYKLMLQSEIFCLSSRVEGLPMVLIEAMNAGCCCVSFDVITGPREIIKNNESGLLAKNQDVKDLEEKLRLVMGNDALRKKYSENAPDSVQRYSTERIINRWYILFDRLLN